MIKLIVTEKNGYCTHYEQVHNLQIMKIENKNCLIFDYNQGTRLKNYYIHEVLPLREVELAFLIDTDTMIEYFRYTK